MLPEYCASIVSEYGRDAIVHHWDADGIVSAALLIRAGVQAGRIITPRIGGYNADAILVRLPRGVKTAVVLDYGIPGPEYDRLYARLKGLAVIDHHKTAPPKTVRVYCNPVALRLANEDVVPACSVLALKLYSELLGAEGADERVLAAIGIAGDLAPYIDGGTSHPGLEYARRLLEDTRWSLRRARIVAGMLDSSHRLLDYKCIEESVSTAAREGPEALEGLECAVENSVREKNLLSEALSKLALVAENELWSIYTLSMDAYITSLLGRRLASTNKGRLVALAHYYPSERLTKIYIRWLGGNLEPIRKALRELGWDVAGKESVIVVDLRDLKPEEAVSRLVEALRKSLKEGPRPRTPSTQA